MIFTHCSILTLFVVLGCCKPTNVKRYAPLPPKFTSVTLGNTTSNLPNEYRDGGGGGQINGLNFMIFSDGQYTTGGPPTTGCTNCVNFTSNSIAQSGANGGDPRSLFDFGTTAKGPFQQIPYYYNNGEGDFITGIWPNENIATLCGGHCGVTFPVVINRTAYAHGLPSTLYNTAASISVGAYGPTVQRPVQSLFLAGQPLYGTFSSYVGVDGYLYMFAAVSVNSTTNGANGLKMARVPQGSWSQLSAYQYWNGVAYQSTPPALHDGGVANVFNFSTVSACGSPPTRFGPSSGDVFFSPYYGVNMIVWGQSDAACDNSVRMVYSSSLTGGWSSPVTLYNIPSAGSFSYSVHGYSNYDSTGKTLPLSFAQLGTQGVYIAFANVTFS